MSSLTSTNISKSIRYQGIANIEAKAARLDDNTESTVNRIRISTMHLVLS